ncbi:MAG: MOSC domain-containing protein [bacterium]
MGYVVSVNISKNKGEKKMPVFSPWKVIKDFGFFEDGHSGSWHRQVSLLAIEEIEKARGLGANVSCGDFAENITTSGICLSSLEIGTKLKIGNDIILEVSQIGKACHTKCAIYYEVGSCIMPKKGIFAKVLEGGEIKQGDRIEVCD